MGPANCRAFLLRGLFMFKVLVFLSVLLHSFSAQKVLLVGHDLHVGATKLSMDGLNKAGVKASFVSNLDKDFETTALSFLDGLVIRVVESSDPKSQISLKESDFWVDFLAARGSMIFLADKLDLNVIPEGFFGYLGFSLKSGIASQGNVTGREGDILSHGLSIPLLQENPVQIVVPEAHGDASLYFSNGEIAGIRHQACSFRLVYLSVLPQYFSEPDFANLIGRAVDWILGYGLVPGSPAPDFPLRLMDGTSLSFRSVLEKSPAKVKLVEFMASWCSHCKKQLPEIVKLKADMAHLGFEVVFVDYMESIEVVKQYLSEHPEISWTTGITPDGLGAKKFGVKGLPSLFILDENNVVRHVFRKVTSYGVLRNAIESTAKAQSFEELFSPVLDSSHESNKTF